MPEQGSHTVSHTRQHKREFGRFLRFAAVGLSGTLIDIGVLSVLKTITGLPTLPANLISYSVGIVNNYLLNRVWTFNDTANRRALTQFTQFALVSLVGLLLNTLFVVALEGVFATLIGASMAYLPAKLGAAGLVLLWNYGANRVWTFGNMGRTQNTLA